MIILCCPNCGCQDIEEIDYKDFTCKKCGEKFELARANYDED